ncbi:MAG: nitroreductase family deazaflavin-dependent oxidoreductase [Deltaproteobacteria bacterium]|nr:nitroreductase family deazaflavin-dependent oxidoreductase [Deltaproteobacteria bacterium]MBW2447892.1 nitroreductase family deazaflavin-dependent oxidoreductase [Deltaproteobacteria bacterium]
MPNIRWLLAIITSVHRWLYIRSGGRIGHRLGRQPMLLLHTVGRKSGQPRTTPLLYVSDDDRWLVIASNAGDDRPPAWSLNATAAGKATIQVGRERHDVIVRQAVDDERVGLWKLCCDQYPNYAVYETRTDRPIPVVVLERIAA